MKTNNFWEVKKFKALSEVEWESLCDRCGLCCILRVEDEDTGEVFATNVICSNYDCLNAQCSSYATRHSQGVDCVQLTPSLVREFNWLPDSCAYRIILKGQPLPKSHPLIGGNDVNTHTVLDYYKHIGLVANTKGIDLTEYIVDVTDCTTP